MLTACDRAPFSVSVVIPTYNRRMLINRALNSVFRQSLRAKEIVVVDDGSTDGTVEWLSEQFRGDSKLILERSEQNRGVSWARNRGVELATGDWIAFLDSDDEWRPEKLQLQMEKLNSLSLVPPLIHCNEVWLRNGVQLNQKAKHRKAGGDLFERSLELCLMSPSAVIVNRDFFLKVGGFREDFIVCEDYDLWLRITARYDVAFCEQTLLVKHGGHPDQLSQKLRAMDLYRVRSIFSLLQKLKLHEPKRKVALKVGIERCNLLLRGFRKHNNFQFVDEVSLMKDFFESE